MHVIYVAYLTETTHERPRYECHPVNVVPAQIIIPIYGSFFEGDYDRTLRNWIVFPVDIIVQIFRDATFAIHNLQQEMRDMEMRRYLFAPAPVQWMLRKLRLQPSSVQSLEEINDTIVTLCHKLIDVLEADRVQILSMGLNPDYLVLKFGLVAKKLKRG